MSEDHRTRVTTYGGGEAVQHWQLYVAGTFISDSSVPEHAELFRQIAEAWNAASANDDSNATSASHDAIARLRRSLPCPHYETVEHSLICANCGQDGGESCPVKQDLDFLEQQLGAP